MSSPSSNRSLEGRQSRTVRNFGHFLWPMVRMSKVKLSSPQKRQISQLCKKLRLDFLRLFGSSVSDFSRAGDVDLVFGCRDLSLRDYSFFVSELQKIFKKEIDLVRLAPGLSGVLVREIAGSSQELWRASDRGFEKYVILLDTMLAVAEDDRLSMPPELQRQNRKLKLKRLYVP